MYKTVSRANRFDWLKLGFSLLVLIFFMGYVWEKQNLVYGALEALDVSKLLVVSLIFALSIPNLLCETRKWQTLSGIKNLDLGNSLKAVLVGIGSGFLTPNRLGEFAGRISMFPKRYRHILSMATFMGSGIQGIVTLVFGLIGLSFFPIWETVEKHIPHNSFIYLGVFFAASLGFVWVIRSRFNILWKSFKRLFFGLKSREWGKAVSWATLRYLIFSSQLVIALYTFGYEGSFQYCVGGVVVMFLVQSYIPLTALAELGVREFLAILIFGGFMGDPVFAAVATLVVWFANIGLPLVVGLTVLRNTKVFTGHVH